MGKKISFSSLFKDTAAHFLKNKNILHVSHEGNLENFKSDLVTEYATIQNIANKIIKSDENSNGCIFQIGC